MSKIFLIFMISFTVLLSACGGGGDNKGLTPMPSDVTDPKDEKLFAALTGYIKKTGAPPNSAYDYARVDLNGDGRRDGIALFKLPHSYWCGWDGCGMVIMRATDNGFVYNSAVTGVRGPIHVRRVGTDGWRDIVVRVSGTKMRDKNVTLQPRGGKYPSSLMLAPTFTTPISQLYGETFFR